MFARKRYHEAGNQDETSPNNPRSKIKRLDWNSDSSSLSSPKLQASHSESAQSSRSWHHGLETMVVFGDSYSSFINEEEKSMTWVDSLASKLGCSVHNYARPGHTVENDLNRQLSQLFGQFPPKSQVNSDPILNPKATAYFLFMGINDCGVNEADDLEPIVESLMDMLHTLYIKAGARQFVVFDIPPIHRSPSDAEHEIEERVSTWNKILQTQVQEFLHDTPKATVHFFSSYDILSNVLDHPEVFDFSEDDPVEEGGAIWEDDLHITPAIHSILANHLLR